MSKISINLIISIVVMMVSGVAVATLVTSLSGLKFGIIAGITCEGIGLLIAQNNSMNNISSFLCRCAGANMQVLSTCSGEISKFASIGLTILMTGLFAAISGGYAIYQVFHSIPAALLFSLIWGLMIFNIDRYIVMSIKKTGNIKNELFTALPRFLLAIMISFVVVKPLEVRLFEDRIRGEIVKIKTDEIARNTEVINTFSGFKRTEIELDSARSKSNKIDKEISEIDKDVEYQSLNKILSEREQMVSKVKNDNQDKINFCNIKIKNLSSNQSNIESYVDGNPVFKSDIQEEIYKYKEEIRNRSQKINDAVVNKNIAQNNVIVFKNKYINERKEKQTQIEGDIKENEMRLDSIGRTTQPIIGKDNLSLETSYSNTFITQLEALGRLTDNPLSSLWWINIMLTLLFIIIETAPIFVKLISPMGQYDKSIEAYDVRQEAKMINESNTLMMMDEQICQLKLQAFLTSQQSQSQIIETAISSWSTQKLEELKNDNTSTWKDTDYKKFVDEVANFSKDLTSIVEKQMQ